MDPDIGRVFQHSPDRRAVPPLLARTRLHFLIMQPTTHFADRHALLPNPLKYLHRDTGFFFGNIVTRFVPRLPLGHITITRWKSRIWTRRKRRASSSPWNWVFSDQNGSEWIMHHPVKWSLRDRGMEANRRPVTLRVRLPDIQRRRCSAGCPSWLLGPNTVQVFFAADEHGVAGEGWCRQRFFAQF